MAQNLQEKKKCTLFGVVP